ncbi:MAG: hypothetical protein QF755_01390 [Candidatus Peribacteraceae bacterium]|jgi:hypothetical protein|nr:hypothetical protein [Candidatus Peribacteraceae bacterium]|tara:strand:+ start:1172 stop:1654 length:483 start_codon:yes stop_codon:yes gene_type:complete
MALDGSINRDNLEPVTGHSDQTIAGVMLHQLSHGIPTHAEKGVPSAAEFQQGVQVLGPELGEFAGSAARDEWVTRMADLEETEIGPVKRWLSNLLGKEQHPVLRKSIDWIEQHGDATSAAVQMLLADLYMATDQADRARETYRAALRMHRETRPEVPLME